MKVEPPPDLGSAGPTPEESGPKGRAAANDSLLDAGACLSLLGSLYPLSASLLYYQLEPFLEEAEANQPRAVGLIPRRLVEDNLAKDRSVGVGMDLLPIDATVVFEYNSAAQTNLIEFKCQGEQPSASWPHELRCVVLHVHIEGADGISRVVRVPLQALMTHWGDALAGYQGFAHSLGFLDQAGATIERWTYIGVSEGSWLERMEAQDGAIRSGCSRSFSAAWRKYVGGARVILASELLVLNQTEDAILAWEEAQVDKCIAAGNCLNMVPGGLKGMGFLHRVGALPRERVSLGSRDQAIAEWSRRPESESYLPRVPQMLAQLWKDDSSCLRVAPSAHDELTPAQVLECRRLSADGKGAEDIAAAVGASDVGQVRRLIGAGMRHPAH